MSTIKKESPVQNALKNLCCTYGWSYGAFWSFDQPNSILLNLQDTYFEEKFGSVMDNLLLQVPLGGGIIGQSAYTNKHMWMCSEDHLKEQIFSGSIWDMFLDDYELRCQFSSGMKTIAVIPVEAQGVVQFGSSFKIPETIEFVNQTKRTFQEIANCGKSATVLASLNGQNCNLQNESLIKPDSSSCFFDEVQDFGVPNESFQTGDFNVSDDQCFPPLNPMNLGGNNGDLRDILAPILNRSQPNVHTYSDHVDHPKERLFSKLGIQELLEGVSGISNSCIEGDQVSVKRRKIESSMWEEAMHERNTSGLRMVDGYSVSGSSTVLQGKKQVEQRPKPTKKKAKPGTRPRPKDRQQILDRMAELRQLIPNGEKMSIDCLLDRTIKHMLFLQNVMKQAAKIKQADEQNMSKVNVDDPSARGVTWACELGNQTMVCPLMVEDLGSQGQMLIEMLYDERGLFPETVDMIRRFGLIILKGVMEARGDHIWARYIVEPEVNKQITRHEIFTALVQFLQTTTSGIDTKCTNSWSSLPEIDYHQDAIQDVVNLVDMQSIV